MATRKNVTGVAMCLVAAMGAALVGCGGAASPRAAEPAGAAARGGSGAPPAQMAPAAPARGAPNGASASPRAEEAEAKDRTGGRDERPGLGTEWGEARQSRISTVPFSRADSDTPFATSVIRYNDAEGARAMVGSSSFQRTSTGTFRVARGAISVGLKNDSGGFFRSIVAGDSDYVIGEAGSRYVIVLSNHTDTRFEAVVSVDGLDVLDGRTASFKKRGYLLDPRGELEIDGFRQSSDSVAAFRFGSVRDSYAAQKHGETRNVGVIGVAVFHVRGTNPFRGSEAQKRLDANPFPGQFASPP
ncbi:MAG: hypothetical protein WKG00_35355 [Polyangiaceae bacterium]